MARKKLHSFNIHLYFCKTSLRDEFVATLSDAMRERLAKHSPGPIIGGYRVYYSLPILLANKLAAAQALWERQKNG